MQVSPESDLARLIARRAEANGGRAYLVGGAVRDRLLGASVKDVDLEIYGIEYPALREILSEFGCVTERGRAFCVMGIKGFDIDIALPRRERATGLSHRDFLVTSDARMNPLEAARRRDFTINAMLMDALTGEILDFYGGRRDLENRVIRHVADDTFPEDALRAYRAAQFAARLEAQIAPETLALCSDMDASLISPERVFDEMRKALLKAREPGIYFQALRDMGKLPPLIEKMIGVRQNPAYHPEGDVFNHTLITLNRASSLRPRAKHEFYFMLAALLHDIGKPETTRTDEGGRITSYLHEEAGEKLSREFLLEYTRERDMIKYVSNMTLLHMRPVRLASDKSRLRATRELFDASVCPEDLILLATADSGDASNEEFLFERLRDYRERMKSPMLAGADLIEAGFAPGPGFAELLSRARTLHLAGLDKREALGYIIREGVNK